MRSSMGYTVVARLARHRPPRVSGILRASAKSGTRIYNILVGTTGGPFDVYAEAMRTCGGG